MKRAVASAFALGLCVVASCSPSESGAPTGCTGIADCPLGQVCSRETKSCVPEPANRLIGSFRCTPRALDDTTAVLSDVSEVIAIVGRERFPLPSVFCFYDEENILLTVVFSRLAADVTAFVSTFATIDYGRNDIGPDIDGHSNSAEIIGTGNVRYATSLSGYIAGDDLFTYGRVTSGYVDIALTLAPRETRVRFGASCPNGLADCGSATAPGGGATRCESLADDSQRVCVRPCATSGECSASASSVCTFARCTKACQTDADCESPLRCAPPNTAGEGRGCTTRK